MIPSTLAAEVSGALRDFLSTGFYEVADALPATESGAGPSSDGDGTGSEQPEVDSERAHERREREPDRPGRREAPDAQSGGHRGTRVGPVHRIRYADDLKPDEDSVHLPLIQCRECHATAWGCVKHAGEQRVNQDLRAFYNRFFLRDVDVNYLFPLSPDEPSPQNVPGRELNICGRCGCLAGHDAEACPGCGQDHLTRVFRPEVVVSKGAGKQGNGDDLLARFSRAFEARSGTTGGIDDPSRRYLAEFLHGADPEASLRLRILNRLTEVMKERQSVRNDADTLGRRIRAIQHSPADDASRNAVKELPGERRALQELLKKVNGRDTFGFLADEGLLPNYAFPQEGVTLKSVIFKRRQAEEGEAEAEAEAEADEDDTIVHDYPRPASAALGEFAPQNEFYAGGLRVHVSAAVARWPARPATPRLRC